MLGQHRRRATGRLLAIAMLFELLATSPVRAASGRIVSLNPSLTAILVAIGAQASLLGVDDYSAEQIPAVADLPRVGGLFSPSLEAVVGLGPDLVVLVPSVAQRDFVRRLGELGVRVIAFENVRFDQVLENIERLGALAGRETEAAARIDAISAARAAARRRAEGRVAPDVLVVLQHDPVYVVGRGNFIEEMLGFLGARNLGAEFETPYPRVAAEWVVARAPEVLIDLSPGQDEAVAHWSRWPSIPAVAQGRVVVLDADLISMPGPDLDRALALLSRSLYGDDTLPGSESVR